LTSPEEKFAQRLLARHKITEPPYDLEALVRNYATLEYMEFPTDADGLVIATSSKKKPEILRYLQNSIKRAELIAQTAKKEK
jgi:hypothetical protein